LPTQDVDADLEESEEPPLDDESRPSTPNVSPKDKLFATFYAPLQLKNQEGAEILWMNPTLGSSVFCRPLSLEFAQESPALILKEKSRVDGEIRNLNQTIVRFESGREITVFHEFYLTMADQKVIAILTKSSVQVYNE
jgi:hypothetical protein